MLLLIPRLFQRKLLFFIHFLSILTVRQRVRYSFVAQCKLCVSQDVDNEDCLPGSWKINVILEPWRMANEPAGRSARIGPKRVQVLRQMGYFGHDRQPRRDWAPTGGRALRLQQVEVRNLNFLRISANKKLWSKKLTFPSPNANHTDMELLFDKRSPEEIVMNELAAISAVGNANSAVLKIITRLRRRLDSKRRQRINSYVSETSSSR